MIGSRLGHYEVLELLGKGGMGEVYRATDSKLGREVALKVLPSELAQDPERLARFRREAQMLASVNHPNIAGIYGFEQFDTQNVLIMELAEGEDLAARIDRGAVPLDEALGIATQIAEGLEEAHEKNIVHRDLKPANVMVSAEGKTKILDFGLARAFVGETAVEGDPSLSPTVTAAMTQAGVILGSAAYMSPEQAKGHTVDRRADIWAFGVILFEMITGRALFSGETVSETMASVLKDPVAWDRLPSDLPPGVRALLERCLERDPKLRLRDIGEARIHLKASSEGSVLLSAATSASSPSMAPGQSGRRQWLAWALVVVASMAAMYFASSDGGNDTQSSSEVLQVSIESPSEAGYHLAGANPAPAVLSPNGEHIVFGARRSSGSYSLWVRDLSNAEPTPLAGTENAQYPFWSPDSRSIAYFADGALRIVDLQGRTNREVVRCEDMKGGTWLEDGTILFAPSPSGGIARVSADGGAFTAVTQLDQVENSNSHRLPIGLPDGKHFLFAARLTGASDARPVAVMLGSLDGTAPKQLVEADGQAAYASGHLLYLSQGKLLASPFDLEALDFTGPARIVCEDAGLIPGAAFALFSVSKTGRMLYHPGHTETLSIQLAWFDLEGKRQGYLGENAGIGWFSMSPDGKRVVLDTYDNRNGTGDLYLDDVETGVRSRLTFADQNEAGAVWSSDSKTIYYNSDLGPSATIMKLRPDSPDAPEIVRTLEGAYQLLDVSPDDQWLALTIVDSTGSGRHLIAMDLQDTEVTQTIDETVSSAMIARFSPDGRWLLYNANVDGTRRLFLKTFPLSPRKWEIVRDGAVYFDWDPSGSRVYFQGTDDKMHAVDVDLSGGTPRFGEAVELFDSFPTPMTRLHTFVMSTDGTRFLVADSANSSDVRPARLVLNWPALLDSRR